MAKGLSMLAVLAEDLDLGPSAHIRWVTIVCNSITRGPSPPGFQVHQCVPTCAPVNTEKLNAQKPSFLVILIKKPHCDHLERSNQSICHIR